MSPLEAAWAERDADCSAWSIAYRAKVDAVSAERRLFAKFGASHAAAEAIGPRPVKVST